MRKQASNTFNDGINLDISPYMLPNTTMSDCVNCELSSDGGNQFMLQNNKGNVYTSELKEEYVPIASSTYKGVAYIYSAEVIGGAFTGRGEIGSFPSPNYENLSLREGSTNTLEGFMTPTYQPLKNYLNELYDPNDPLVLYESLEAYGTAASVYGDFNSELFNCKQDTNYEMQIQQSYDGSVNIIIVDNVNPPIIINTRFAALKSNRVEIIDRTGLKDVNLYNSGLFDTTLKLIQSSNKIVDVDLEDITETGILECGTYRYYFAYQTQDGNYTDVIAETFQVPIFKGTTLLDIDAPAGISSGKSVSISLKNLDTSFSNLRVYYTHHYGEDVSLSQTYLINSTIPVTNSSLVFTHTGREESIPIDSSVISTTFAAIDTVRTIAQSQSRLFLGNITLQGYDVNALSEFASRIKPKFEIKRFEYKPADFNARVISGTESVVGEVGFRNGYYNPYNVYYNGSYWGGETYMFGVVFILNSGKLTPAFPIRGIDDWSGFGNASYDTQTLDENNDYFDIDSVGENLKGVYRFPSRNVPVGLSEALKLQEDAAKLKILALALDVPDDYPEGTIGCMFVRADRVPDVVTQGIAINTVGAPIVDTTPQDYTGNKYWNYDWREDSIKYIPAYNYIVEGQRMSGDRNANQGTGDDGLTPFQLTDRIWTRDVFNTWKRRYALVTPDLYREATSSAISGTGFTAEVMATVTHKTTVPTEAWWEQEGFHASWWSVLRQTSSTTKFSSVGTSVDYVLSSQEATTINGFSSTAAFAAERNTSINKSYLVLRNNYNSYLGLATDSSLGVNITEGVNFYGNTAGSDIMPNKNPEFGPNQLLDSSVHLNIYKDLGFSRGVNSADLKRIATSNNPVTKQFSPISKRLYWSEDYKTSEEGAVLDTSRTFYGGDCFPAETFRRMFYNSESREGIVGGAQAVVNSGYTISIVCESSTIPSMRSSFIFDITEENIRRDFYPNLLDTVTTPLEDRYNRSHQWREYRAPETTTINEGGKWLSEERIISPIDPTLPYLKQRFPTRVMYSDVSTYDSFVNGYRNVFPTAVQDYNQDYGDIIALREINNVLICVQERAVSILQINEREPISNTSSGAVYLQGAGVLSPYAQVLNSNYGSSLQDSITKSENSVYGMDDQGKMWRVGGQGLEFISSGVIETALKSFVPDIANREIDQLYNNLKTHYDKDKKTIYIASYTSTDLDNTSEGVSVIPAGEEDDYVLSGWTVTYETLAQYSNGLLTGTTKPNVIGDPDYIAPEFKAQQDNPCPFEEEEPFPLDVDIFVIWDTTSFSAAIKSTLQTNVIYPWLANFRTTYPQWVGNFIEINAPSSTSGEQWLNWVNYLQSEGSTKSILIAMVDESHNSYHNEAIPSRWGSNGYTLAQANTAFATALTTVGATRPQANYIADYNSFLDLYDNYFEYFKGMVYAIPSAPNDLPGLFTNFQLHVYAAIEGTTVSQLDFIPSQQGDIEIIKDENLYSTLGAGLKQYGWQEQHNFAGQATDLTLAEFTADVNPLILEGTSSSDNFTGWRVQESSAVCEPLYKKLPEREQLYNFVYKESTQRWITRYSYLPIHSFNIRDAHFTFNLLKDSYKMWEHHSNSVRCNYYGDQYEFELEFCVNQDPLSQKIFTNFIIASNEVPPKYIMYDTDNEIELDDIRPTFIAQKPMVLQNIYPRFRGRYNTNDIRHSYLTHNCDWKENHHYIEIDKNTNDTRDNSPNLQPELFDNNREISDKFVRVRVRYAGDEYSIIQAIITKVIMSYA